MSSVISVTVVGDAKPLQQSLDRLGQEFKETADEAQASGRKMADSFDRAGDAADASESKFMGMADILDGLGSAFGLPTDAATNMMRAFGDLTGGFAQIGPMIGQTGQKLKDYGTTAINAASNVGKATASMIANGAKAMASTVAQIGRQIAAWALLGAQSLLHAAKVALAWLIAMGPIALVIAAVVGLVALIIANWDTVKEWTGKAWDWVSEKISGVWDAIKGFVSAGFDFIKDLFFNFTPLGIFIKHWDEILAFIKELPGKISRVASGMWDGISKAFKAAVNFIIRGWNNLDFKIPGFSLGPVKFDGFTLGLPDIPMLAKGGIVTGPTLAMIGEAGPEAVVPLDRAGAMGGTTVNIYMPPGSDGEDVVEAIRRYERRNGNGWRT